MFLAFTLSLVVRLKSLEAKIGIPIISVLILATFFLSYGYQLELADLLFYKMREERLNNFVKEINDYEKIFNFSGNGVNNVFINLEDINKHNYVDTETSKTLDSLQLDPNVILNSIMNLKNSVLKGFAKRMIILYILLLKDFYIISMALHIPKKKKTRCKTVEELLSIGKNLS